MSEIPYYFETPIPKYFRETQWFDNPNSILFIHWAFSRCSPEARTVNHDYCEVNLQPYEFIAGRGKSSKQAHMTEAAFKNQLKALIKAGLLKKTTNSKANRFSCYIWVVSRFSKPINQLNNQLATNWRPTERPQSRIEKTRSKESHHPYPSSQADPIPGVDDDLTDDFSFEKNSKIMPLLLLSTSEGKQHNVYYRSRDKSFITICEGVSLSKTDLEACVKIKGSFEAVKYAIEYIQSNKKRKHPISDWPNALSKWKIENKTQTRVEENLTYAKQLFHAFSIAKTTRGWKCVEFKDKKKDQQGILFESDSPHVECVFIPYVDGDFQNKCAQFLLEHKLVSQKAEG